MTKISTFQGTVPSSCVLMNPFDICVQQPETPVSLEWSISLTFLCWEDIHCFSSTLNCSLIYQLWKTSGNLKWTLNACHQTNYILLWENKKTNCVTYIKINAWDSMLVGYVHGRNFPVKKDLLSYQSPSSICSLWRFLKRCWVDQPKDSYKIIHFPSKFISHYVDKS